MYKVLWEEEGVLAHLGKGEGRGRTSVLNLSGWVGVSRVGGGLYVGIYPYKVIQ